MNTAFEVLDGPRCPDAHELQEVIELVNDVFSPDQRSLGEELPQLLSAENLERLRVFRSPATGRTVAHAGYVRCELLVEGHSIPAAALGCVCTLPEHRGAGLASHLVSSLMAQARAEGLALMVISGDSQVYKRLGAVETGDFVLAEADDLDEVRRRIHGAADGAQGCCDTLDIEEAAPVDVPDMAALYRREPVRYARPVECFRQLMWWQPCQMRLGGFEHAWIAWARRATGDAPEALAYVVTRARPGDDAMRGLPQIEVTEFAGARWAVAQLIAHAAGLFAGSFRMVMPRAESELVQLLRQAGVMLSPTTLPRHTIAAIHPGLLLERVRPILAERVSAGDVPGGGADLEALSPPELVNALFCGERAIPLPVPGLNYV